MSTGKIQIKLIAPSDKDIELLPCSNCGSKDIGYEFSASQGYVKCNKCQHEGGYHPDAADPICSISAAYAAWNKR
jgi:hypothetical protein